MQNSRFFFVVYGLLAVAAFLIIFVSCGKGTVEPIQEEWMASSDVTDRLIKECFKEGESSVGKEGCEIVGHKESSSSQGSASSDSEGDESSSSEEEDSSSSEEGQSSNGEEPSSSSTGPTHTLTCTRLAATGTKGQSVNRPTVKCGNDSLNSSNVNFIWRKDRVNGETVTGSFSSAPEGEFFIFAKEECGGEVQEKSCGNIYISDGTAESSSSTKSSSSATEFFLNCALPANGTVGVSIDPSSIVTCNGTSISASNLTWSDSKFTTSWFSSPTAGTYNSITVTAKSGNCSGKTEPCGSITITNPPSSTSGGSSGSGGDCSRSGWCDYGANVDGTKNCSQMPTDDCCADGKIVSSESQCSTTPKFCNWGRCEGGRGWDCTSGGCFPKPADKETCDGGAPIVSCCPSGTTPPSGSANLCK